MRNVFWTVCLLGMAQVVTLAAPAVVLKPGVGSVDANKNLKFTATVTDVAVKYELRWFVNAVRSGNATVGRIDGTGLFTAPAIQPASTKVTVGAEVWTIGSASKAAAKLAGATGTVTVNNTAQISLTPSSQTVPLGAAYDFHTTVTGAPAGLHMRWFINGVADGSATLGTVNASGYYRAPAAPQAKMTLQLKVELLAPGTPVRVLATDISTIQLKNTNNVKLTPESVAVAPGAQQQFAAAVTGAQGPTKLRWLVSDIAGGNATVGTITATGLYKAPATAPAAKPIVKVELLPSGTSTSVLDFDTSTVSVKYPPLVLTSLLPGVVKPGAYTLTLRGTGFRSTTTAVVNGVAAKVTYVSATEVRITGTAADQDVGNLVTVRLINPAPDASADYGYFHVRTTTTPLLSNTEAHRFLRQATWGPTPTDLDRVRRIGKQPWLQEQFAIPWSSFPEALLDKPLEYAQEHFLKLALEGEDQLRLRMAFALHKIWVVSGVEVDRADQYIPYFRVLMQHSFGNFFDVMRDVTLSAAMGDYLDMANNIKGNPQTGAMPNENYGREIKQLFTLGLFRLNPDGTQQLDPMSQPIPTYTQDDVLSFARVFTGWTYSDGKPGAPTSLQYHDKGGPMEAVQKYHDTGVKNLLLGTVLPANQTAETDLDQALRNIFQHPNVGPFIGKQLIQQLVTSHPSDAYVQRVAAAFNNNGQGVRGDLKAVLTAILLDPEANLSAPNAGKLMEPVLFVTNITRGLQATVTDTPYLADFTTEMGQKIFYPPSVFSYFSPGYRIAGGTRLAPEFQIYTTATAMARVNFVAQLLGGHLGGGVKLPWTALTPLGREPELLLNHVDEVFMGSRMSPEMRTLILQAMLSAPSDKEKVQTALYLTLMSPQFQVQR